VTERGSINASDSLVDGFFDSAYNLIMFAEHILAQASSVPNASTIFFITLMFVFFTAIITTLVTKWSRDKCLKFLDGYHVTVERGRGHTIWGSLKVFSAGIELVFDHAYVDYRGQKKTSFLIYQQEVDQLVLSILRFHNDLDAKLQERRQHHVLRTFNPGPMRRLWREVRNVVNTLRDAFNAAIGAAVGQYQRLNPAASIIGTQAGSVQQIGQTLIGKFAGNAFEPLLEQYIGQPVILEVADPINPNNDTVQYTGYLADYTQNFVAVFNVEHKTGKELWLNLPDIEYGDDLPPLPPAPAPGAPPPVLSEPVVIEHDLAVRIDGYRMMIQNTRDEAVVVQRLEREGFEPLKIAVVIPVNGTLDLPARDAHGGKLFVQVIRCLDVVAPRKYATIRNAGELVERRGFADELEHSFDRLPLVPKFFNHDAEETERIE
jgi:hypothetical protein